METSVTRKGTIDFLLESCNPPTSQFASLDILVDFCSQSPELMDSSCSASESDSERSPKRRYNDEDEDSDEPVCSPPQEINWDFRDMSANFSDRTKRQKVKKDLHDSCEAVPSLLDGYLATKAMSVTQDREISKSRSDLMTLAREVLSNQPPAILRTPHKYNDHVKNSPVKLPLSPPSLSSSGGSLPLHIPSNGIFHPSPIPNVSRPAEERATTGAFMAKMLQQTGSSLPTGIPPMPASFVAQNQHRSQEELVSWWLMTLRAQTYCYILNDARTDQDKRFHCVFSNTCEKRIKGKGNLRRHIEWHLRRIEEEWKSNQTNSMASTIASAVAMPSEMRKSSESLSRASPHMLQSPSYPVPRQV